MTRYDFTAHELKLCDGTDWISLQGSGGGAQVAFSAHNNGADQTVTSGQWTKLNLSTEDFDTNDNFTASRFTPTVAGKYLVTLTAACQDGTWCYPGLSRNGSVYLQSWDRTDNGSDTVTALIDMNGTTDYIEGYIYNQGGTKTWGSAAYTRMSGFLIGSNSGGGSSPWDDVTGGLNYAGGKVGIGTATPGDTLDVNGDIGVQGTGLFDLEVEKVYSSSGSGERNAVCPAGKFVISGGCTSSGIPTDFNFPYNTTTWKCRGYPSTGSVTAYALCGKVKYQ